MAASFLQHRPGAGVGSESEVPVSADDPLPVTLAGGGAVTPQASPTVGGVPNNYRIPSSAATNNAALIAAGPHQVYFVIAYNTSTSLRFMKLYNRASGVPNPATDTPVVSLPIPPGGGIALDLNIAIGLFPLGLAIALVQNAADNDNTAVAAGDIVGVNIGYA